MANQMDPTGYRGFAPLPLDVEQRRRGQVQPPVQRPFGPTMAGPRVPSPVEKQFSDLTMGLRRATAPRPPAPEMPAVGRNPFRYEDGGNNNPYAGPEPMANSMGDSTFQSVLQQAMKGLQGGGAPTGGSALPVSQLAQLTPHQMPELPAAPSGVPGLMITGRRPQPHTFEGSQQEWMAQEDAETERIMAPEYAKVKQEHDDYQNALNVHRNMAAAQGNALFGAKAGLAGAHDKAWQDAQLGGFSNPAEARQFGSLMSMLEPLSGIEGERIKAQSVLGAAREAADSRRDVALLTGRAEIDAANIAADATLQGAMIGAAQGDDESMRELIGHVVDALPEVYTGPDGQLTEDGINYLEELLGALLNQGN